jgi:anti-sigma factor RsiW
MCPDKQLLSVYYDDELPSPWKEKMEAHLVSCADCRTALANYGKLSSWLNLPVSAVSETEMLSVERMREKQRSVRDRPVHRRASRIRRVFARRVTVPLPFAVAAAAALVFAFATLLTQMRTVQRVPEPDAVAEGINLEPEEIPQVTSIDDALRFIETNEFFNGPPSSYVIMRLPENKTFYNLGNPQIQNVTSNAAKGRR